MQLFGRDAWRVRGVLGRYVSTVCGRAGSVDEPTCGGRCSSVLLNYIAIETQSPTKIHVSLALNVTFHAPAVLYVLTLIMGYLIVD